MVGERDFCQISFFGGWQWCFFFFFFFGVGGRYARQIIRGCWDDGDGDGDGETDAAGEGDGNDQVISS